MATVKFKIERSKLTATGIGEPSLYEIDASNIEDLESACAKYREETKLPDCMSSVMLKLHDMRECDYRWLLDVDGRVVFDRRAIEVANAFPALWQAEKLHALACMEQVWIALHDGDFEWFDTDNAFFVLVVDGDGVRWAETEYDDVFQNPFPFKTGELADQARRILGDDLIKKAFSVK